jgi:FkbM family methyltransferase
MCVDIFTRALLGFQENADFKHRVYALNVAASAVPSTMEASIDSCHGCYMTDGSVSCGGSEKQAGQWKRQKTIDSINVEAVVQALGFKEVRLLHIDTEGHETSVLRGLEPLLTSKSVKNLIVETRPAVWKPDDDKWLRNVLQIGGYKCWRLHNLYNPHLPNIGINDQKPPIDLTSPIPATDMFCSVVHSNLDFADSVRGNFSCIETHVGS